MGTPTQEENRAAWSTLKSAYDDGILKIPATLRTGIREPVGNVPECFLKALAEQPNTRQRVDLITDQFDEPARDTRRVQYQDVGWRYFTRDIGPLVVNLAYEIARFICSPDETGAVKYVGTYVGVADDSGDMVSMNPLDPWALEHAGVNGYWFLRYYQGTFQPMPPPDVGVTLPNIAGYPFPELAYWFDYRFQWGRTANETFFLVPSNHALRLYFVPTVVGTPPANRITEILGRMVGFTQPVDTVPAAKNVLYAW